jgi:predicted permease
VNRIEEIGSELRSGVRMLRRRPGVAATAILSLALGIGASTEIFSLLDQALFRSLPVRAPDQLVMITWRGATLAVTSRGEGGEVSYPFCSDLQQQTAFFQGAFCRATSQVNLSRARDVEQVSAELVSGAYFPVLGIQPAIGRLLGPADDVRPGDHPVAVLSYDYWQNRLAGAPDIVGRSILINKRPITIIGVAPSGFRGIDIGTPATVWLSTMMVEQATLEFSRVLDRRAAWVQVFARLRDGVTANQARTGLHPWLRSMLAADMRRDDFPRATETQQRAYLTSTLEVQSAATGWSRLRQTVARPLWLLMAGTGLLLALAALNVASLLVAVGAERRDEITTRLALGASRRRIARQFVIEALLLGTIGAALGLAIAPVVGRVLLRFLPVSPNVSTEVDLRASLFAAAVAVAASMLCGTAPAMQAWRHRLTSGNNGRSTQDRVSVRFRKILVSAQLALALLLLVAAGLFVQTFMRLESKDRGFDSESLVMFGIDPAGSGSAQADAPRVVSDILRAMRELPVIERASLANNMLLGSLGASRAVVIDGDPPVVAPRPVPILRIGTEFFATLGTRLVAGREFDDTDTKDVERTGFRTAIVNQSFVRQYLGGRAAVGRRIGIGTRPDTPMTIEIVGVVDDFSRRFVRDDYQPEHLFFPFATAGPLAGDGDIYLRVRGKPEAAFPAVRAAVARIDPTLPLNGLTAIEGQVSRALGFERMLAAVSTGFGSVALILSAIGLFGVMSFVVTQRTQEIGVRLALGATRTSAISLVVRDALTTIATGAIAGTLLGGVATIVAGRWLSTILYGVTPADPGAFAASASLLALASLAACLVPAARAAVLSPMAAIRDQPDSMWREARTSLRHAVRELARGGERADSTGGLMTEVAGVMQRISSFSTAVATALDALRQRVDASAVILLERRGDVFRNADHALPADGLLTNRLRHYPHPLPLGPADLQAWRRWAEEHRPSYLAEIDAIARSDVRVAVPLRTSAELIGILLLSPSDRRDTFSRADLQVLSGAADLFALLIENGHLHERELGQEKLRRDLALAAEVQRRLLPPRPPSSPIAAFGAFTLPARAVGGDYYDFVETGDRRIGLAIADVAGKGIAAAMLTSAVQAYLRVIASDADLSCADIAARLNHLLYASTSASSYVTFFYAQFDGASSRLRYVNAGHTSPYLVRRTDGGVTATELNTGGTVLGLFSQATYEQGEIDLRAGDVIVACTDGVTEARNAGDEEFGEDRLKALLAGAIDDTADGIAERLAAAVQEWMAGAEQHDDVTLVTAVVK